MKNKNKKRERKDWEKEQYYVIVVGIIYAKCAGSPLSPVTGTPRPPPPPPPLPVGYIHYILYYIIYTSGHQTLDTGQPVQA